MCGCKKQSGICVGTNGAMILLLFPQILVDTAQKRQALNEVEARHMEIIQLEANIRVSPIPIHTRCGSKSLPFPTPPAHSICYFYVHCTVKEYNYIYSVFLFVCMLCL